MPRRLLASTLLFSTFFYPGPLWAEAAREKAASPAPDSPQTIQETFLKGKALYDAGDSESAIRAWEALEPHLDAYPSVRKVIAYLKAQATAPPGAAPKADAAEISATLEEAAGQMRARRDETERAQAAMGQSGADRAAWIEDAFRKGREAAREGDWATAVAEWEKLASYLDESAPERAIVEALKRDYFASEKARAETRRLVETGRQKIKAPPAFSETLEEAKSQVRAQLAQAQSQAAAADQARREREAWVDAALVRARAAYEEGRIEPAIAEWEKTLPHLDDEAGLREKIKTLRESLKALGEARQAGEGVTADAFRNLKVPLGDRLTAEIARATDILRTRTGRALEEQSGVQKSLAERQEWIAAQFEKGRRFLDEGRLLDALAQWEPILPHVEDGEGLRASFDRLAADVKSARDAEEAAARKREASAGKLKAPTELSDLVDRALKELSKRRGEAESRLKESEAALLKRQKEAGEAFEKGKAFYLEGKYWEAASAWRDLLPHVEESPQIEKWIGQFEAAYRDYLESKSAVDGLAGGSARRFAAPADLVKLLTQAQRDVEARTAALVAERASMEKGRAEHETWVQDAFRKGKSLYDQGRTDLAIGEWEKLLPHLEESASERALILELRRLRDEAAAAQETIGALAASGTGRIQAPADFKLVLESAADAIRSKKREFELERQAVERSIAQRRDAMLEILQGGKDAFDAGRIDEALVEWKKLLEYVDARSKLDETLRKAEDLFRSYREAGQTLADAQSRGGARFEPPQELAAAIQTASDRIAAAVARARAEEASLEKESAARKQWLDQTYQTGKQHYAAGRLEEAVEEWSKLGPYLPEDTGLPAKLTALKAAKDEAARAKKEAVEAAARQYKGLRIEPLMESFLADIAKDLKTQAIQAEKDRLKTEEDLAARQKKAEAVLREAKALYDSGDLSAAVGSWAGLLPHLDETSDAHRAVTNLRTGHDNLLKMRRALEEAQKKSGAGVALPSDFAKLADEARGRLAAQTQAADAELQKAKAVRRDREKAVSAAYEAARTKLWSGDVAGAVEGWKGIAPQTEGIDPLVKSLETELAETGKAQKDAAAAAARSTEKLAAPAGFAKEVETARAKIREQTRALLDQKAESETGLAARQQSADQAFDRGKSLYWAGKVPEALNEWQAVASSVSDAGAAKAFVELQKAQERLDQAQAGAAAAAAQAAGKLAAPAEFPKLLALAIEKAKARTEAAQAEKAKLAEELAARRARAEQAYQKGAAALAAGKYAEAVSEWRPLVSLLDAQSGVGALLDGLEEAVAAAETARRQTDEYAAGEFKDIRFPHGDEIAKRVSEAQVRLAAAAADSQKRKADMEKTFADRQAWVESTFQKGKALFEAGHYTEAMEFWRSLAPYLTDGARMQDMLGEFERLQAETAAAAAAALEAEAKKDMRFPAPAEITGLLAAASEKMKTAQFEARTRRELAEQALSDRRIAIQTAFEKGKAAYEKGGLPAALDEWVKMLPLVENEPQVKGSLDAVRKAYDESIQSRKDADAAEAQKQSRLPAPVELKPVLASVTDRMAKEIQASDTRRALMEKALSDRRAFVRGLFDRGKALYDEGKLPEAFDLWKTMGPYVEEEEKLNELLGKAGQAYQGFVAAKAAHHEAALRRETKLPAPPELLALVDEAAARFKQDDFDARGKTFEIEKSISDRREWIVSTFKRGQALFIEGRLAEAIAEWNTLLPYLDDGLEVKAQLVEIEKNAAIAEKSRKILEESQAGAKLQFQSPKELSELLLRANEDLKNQMFAASAEKTKAEQTLAERQKWMSQTFSLGQTFYAEGRIEEAVAEWTKLKPYLDNQPAVAEMMDTLEKNYEALQTAKKEAVEATAEDYKGLKLAYSDQMAKVLEAAVKKVNDDTLALREKLDKTHGVLAERKEWSVTTFNKGKVLYEDGRYAEATAQWERLLPYLEDGSALKTLIESFKKSHAEWTDRSTAIGELEKRKEKPVALAQPETMAVTVKEAADKMKAQAEAAAARAADLEKELGDRKAWIDYTFQKGKTHFDQGRYAEAVGEWGVLGPYLAEHPEVRAQIEEAKRSYAQFRKADQILQNAETKKAALPPLPEGARPPAEEEPAPAPAEPAQEEAPPQAEAPAPAPQEPAASPAEELVSGEVVSVDKAASLFRIRSLIDGVESDVRFDGATQWDGESAVTVDSLEVGSTLDARMDRSTGRASYIYLY